MSIIILLWYSCSAAYHTCDLISILIAATGRLLLDTSRRFPESGYLSPLYTYGYEIWGLLCSELWNDVNADVACRELGFAGGVAASFDNDANNIPYLLSVECAGTETRLKDCQQMEIFCSTRKLAGVFCYQNESKLRVLHLIYSSTVTTWFCG